MSPWGPRKSTPPPPPPERKPPKPTKEPNCTCGDYKWVNGHWTQIYNPKCPVHGGTRDDE